MRYLRGGAVRRVVQHLPRRLLLELRLPPRPRLRIFQPPLSSKLQFGSARAPGAALTRRTARVVKAQSGAGSADLLADGAAGLGLRGLVLRLDLVAHLHQHGVAAVPPPPPPPLSPAFS